VLKYLLLLAVVAVAFAYVVARARSARRRRDEPPVQATVRCDRCGVYVPQAAAVRVNGRAYCCVEHGRSR
jgi:uncharacterized protein